MVDIDALEPWLIGFFVIATVATVVSIVVLVHEITAARRARQARSVVQISSADPGAAAVNRRAA